jgi:TPR repeat protein
MKTKLKVIAVLMPVVVVMVTLTIMHKQHTSSSQRPPVLIALEDEGYQKAASLLLQDAEAGKPLAQWSYAELVDMDLAATVNPNETAAAWYRKAAEAGFRPAQVKLGQVQPGIGDYTDYADHKFRLLHIQALHGSRTAALIVEHWYLKHNQPAQSVYWLNRAINPSKPDDMANYYAANSLFYLHGSEDDQRRAIELMRAIAEQGFIKEQFGLARMLEIAKGRQRNGWEAEKWYRRAAEKGHADAQARLGVMYLEGDLVGLQSDHEALRWLKKAAEPRKDRFGFSYVQPAAKLALLYYLDKGIKGSHRLLHQAPLPSELEYLMLQDGYDLQKAYHATAIGIRNTDIDFVQKEVSAAAEYGKKECGEGPECRAFTTWFQLLAGQSREVIADAKQLKEIGTAKAFFHLGHALLLHDRKEEALQMYEQGLAKATRHELFLLDDELDLLGWHYSRNHLLFAAARITLSDQAKLFTEEEILKHEEVKALRAELVKDRLIKEVKP